MAEVFFIRGHAKSGTNWLCRIVNLHPSVTAKGEFHLEQLFDGLGKTTSARWGILKKHTEVLESRFYEMVENLIKDLCEHNEFCADRTPGGILESYIPGKKCLYISRDGRDVLVSWTFHAFRHNLHTNPELQSKQSQFDLNPDHFEVHKSQLLNDEKYVRGFARKWNNFIVRDLNNMKLADQGIINLSYYHVQYEQLHSDTDFYRQEVYEFLGLDPTSADTLDDKTTPGFNRIDNSAFLRRGEMGSWQEYFTKEQSVWFAEEASEALQRLGFTV